MGRLSLEQCHDLCVRVLVAHDTSALNAGFVASALVSAEAEGHSSHGLARLPDYAAQAAAGKVNGHAEPLVNRCAPAMIRIDAGHGFAYRPLAVAVDELDRLARATGIAVAAIHRSHHFGAAGLPVEELARRGLVGLLFGNSPAAIAPWGGRRALFGTNPIAFAAPLQNREPLVIDLSLSRAARGRVMLAARRGERIPEGWALDPEGRPTTDPAMALAGTMLPMGDAKGYALVLMVEILAAAMAGANFGFEASTFFDAAGPPPGVGQVLLAIDPGPLSGGTFGSRLSLLIDAIDAEPGARLPGTRRSATRVAAQRSGLEIDDRLLDRIAGLIPG